MRRIKSKEFVCPLLVIFAIFLLSVAGAGAEVAEVQAQTFHKPSAATGRGNIGKLLTESRRIPPKVPLPEIILNLSGKRLLDWEGEDQAALVEAARYVLSSINERGISAARVNEVGNAVESVVMDALRKEGFETEIPESQSGHRKVSGYPDLSASRGERFYYIEVKTYHPDNVKTTQRSFYLSPSLDSKVVRDAFHLLVAFTVLPADDGTYRASSFKWLDLFDLKCKLKLEFNASNRDLYSTEKGLIFHNQD